MKYFCLTDWQLLPDKICCTLPLYINNSDYKANGRLETWDLTQARMLDFTTVLKAKVFKSQLLVKSWNNKTELHSNNCERLKLNKRLDFTLVIKDLTLEEFWIKTTRLSAHNFSWIFYVFWSSVDIVDSFETCSDGFQIWLGLWLVPKDLITAFERAGNWINIKINLCHPFTSRKTAHYSCND